jgi:hypothetical protein
MQGLSVSNVVDVVVNLTPSGAAPLSFGVLMIAGDSPVINGTQRFQTFTNIDSVANEFGTTAPEYLAASLYFEQSPVPAQCMIGRWFSSAAAAQLDGGILSASQQMLANFTAISNGSFVIVIDGATHTLTGLNFTGVTNLNGVASIITTALSGPTCTWNGENFVISSGTSGLGLQATGTVTFTGNPANNDTLTLNGQLITFVTGTPGANQVQIGATDTATAANLQYFLMNSTDADLVVASYSTTGLVLTITYNQVGTAGNSYSLAKSSSDLTLSGSDLSGGTVPSSVGYATTAGSGTDISTLLQLTAATAQALIPGFNAETPVQCAEALANLSTAWYGLMFASTVSISDTQNEAVAAFIEAQSQITRTFGITTQETSVLSALVTNDIASTLQALGYDQTFVQYSSTNPYAAASFFGRAFSVDFTQGNSTIILMFKQEPGVIAETLTQAQASVLQSKNCNVFVNYVNNTSILQYGTMASGQFFDTIQGIDWLQNLIQTNVYNVLYTNGKVPQTDAGVNQITNAIAAACGQGVTNGFIAGGTWNGPSFGSLQQGTFLKAGYYIYAEPVAMQSEAARAARQCPPIQVAVKLAGGIQSVNILVQVNQ